MGNVKKKKTRGEVKKKRLGRKNRKYVGNERQ